MRISQAIKLLQAWQDAIGDVPLTSRERFLAMEGDFEVNIHPLVCELGVLSMPVGDRIFLAIDGGGLRPGKHIDVEYRVALDKAEAAEAKKNHE